MAYTEIQEKNNKKYYYRVRSVKSKGKVNKMRKYMGSELNAKELSKLEAKADKELNQTLNVLLSKKEIKELESIKSRFNDLPAQTAENRYEAFVTKFTYDSNAIEGNTISLNETSYLLFENRAPAGKSMREINETLNHKKAFDFILNYKKDITKDFICKIQEMIVENTLRIDLMNQAGKYRDVQVYIRGVEFMPAKPKDVPKEMRTLVRWYNANKKKVHPLILAAYFHVAFESIHPFVDGNGRTGRLLLNFILHRNGFPMIDIQNKRRLEYYQCLEEGQLRNDINKFVRLLLERITKDEAYI